MDRLCFALCFMCWSLLPFAAQAEEAKRPWVFVPVARGGLPVARAAALTSAWEAAVVAQGERVVPNEEAAEQVRAYSAEPVQLDAAARAAIERRLRSAQAELAVQPSSPLRMLRELSDAERDAVAQSPKAASQMEAICLTQLEYELKSRGHVQEQARFCRELFPALQPGNGIYPPEVLSELEAAPRSEVRVAAPAGCRVLLNGSEVGVAPATFSAFRVPARVQLVCDGVATRVHPVQLGEHTSISIDPGLDAMVRTDRGLYLLGAVGAQVTLGQWLGARVIPLQVQIVDGRIRVQPMSASRPLWFDLSRGYTDDDISLAVQELRGAAHRDLRARNSQVSVQAVPPRGEPLIAEGATFPLGPVLLGGGGVAMLAAGLTTGLLGRSRDADVRRFAESCAAPCGASAEQRAEIQRAESEATAFYTATTVLVIGGGVALGAALTWFFLRPAASGNEQSLAVFPRVSPEAVEARLEGHF
jgi:hypothetical protein